MSEPAWGLVGPGTSDSRALRLGMVFRLGNSEDILRDFKKKLPHPFAEANVGDGKKLLTRVIGSFYHSDTLLAKNVS